MTKAVVKEVREEEARTSNLFMTIDTINVDGQSVGYRVVDLYHYGTRNWLMNHQWWALHQGHTVEVRPAMENEVTAYLAYRAKELQDKFQQPAAA